MRSKKKYTDLFKQEIKTSKGFGNLFKESYTEWSNKYLKNKEKQVEKFTGKFIPGKIYSFDYRAQKVTDFEDETILSILDHRPIILSLGPTIVNEKVMEAGINFNTIPFQYRPQILDRIYYYFGNVIDENQKNISEGRSGIKPLKINYQVCEQLLPGTGWSMSYMVFDRSMISKPDVIDYNDWPMVLSINTKSIQGTLPGDLYQEYITKLQKNRKL